MVLDGLLDELEAFPQNELDHFLLGLLGCEVLRGDHIEHLALVVLDEDFEFFLLLEEVVRVDFPDVLDQVLEHIDQLLLNLLPLQQLFLQVLFLLLGAAHLGRLLGREGLVHLHHVHHLHLLHRIHIIVVLIHRAGELVVLLELHGLVHVHGAGELALVDVVLHR